MATTVPSDRPGYRNYTEEEGTHEALPMSIVTNFWLSVVNAFGALYEAVFTSVYSRKGNAKLTPQAAKQCVTKFFESFPGLTSFMQLTIFDEGDTGARDLCNKVAVIIRQLETVMVITNLKKTFDDAETTFLMLGIRLASSPLDIRQGWIGGDLPSTTIADAWVGAGEVFGELWIQDTVMEEVDTVIEDFDNGIE